jgi:hypothetical protein
MWVFRHAVFLIRIAPRPIFVMPPPVCVIRAHLVGTLLVLCDQIRTFNFHFCFNYALYVINRPESHRVFCLQKTTKEVTGTENPLGRRILYDGAGTMPTRDNW